MIVRPKEIYDSLDFSFPSQHCAVLIDDTTKTTSTRCSWVDRNVAPVFDAEARTWMFYRIEPFPESHYID